MFIGGVPTENYDGRLNPVYRSNLPNLLGCVRGLMIGERLIDMRDRTFWPYFNYEKGFFPVLFIFYSVNSFLSFYSLFILCLLF